GAAAAVIPKRRCRHRPARSLPFGVAEGACPGSGRRLRHRASTSGTRPFRGVSPQPLHAMVIRARLPRGDGGFTQVEMLAAVLVPAIGLLGGQALGAGAARIIARADFQTEAVAAATAAMEARQQAIQAGRWVSGAA